MTDDPFHDSVEALRATGHTVEPYADGDDHHLWLVSGLIILSAGQLIRHALRLGLMTGPERIQ